MNQDEIYAVYTDKRGKAVGKRRVSDDIIEVIEMGTGNVIKATYQTPDQISNPATWESDGVWESVQSREIWREAEEQYALAVKTLATETGLLPSPPSGGTYGPPGEDWKLGWSPCVERNGINSHYIKVWYSGGRGLTACEQFITNDDDLKKKDRKHCPQCQRIKGG